MNMIALNGRIFLSVDVSECKVSGWGSAWFARRVTHLPPMAREDVRRGKTVVLTGCPKSGGNHGETTRFLVAIGKSIYTRTTP